ncbi:hypothetical protein [Streptomyces sp. DH12]|uniref:hypothetical protein n=1 Tax=Streptomyces sp. DH12 TaxID=2857010 RepID=UPI001E5B0B82|nr:hypothetical protein [Streptomyces sp. DH12]
MTVMGFKSPREVREAIATATAVHLTLHPIRAHLDDWEEAHAADGAPLIRVRVHGPDADRFLTAFTAEPSQNLYTRKGRQAPFLSYDQPGIVVCTVRTGGVWVEMWHPDASPAPAPERPAAVVRGGGPSGRLPLGRFRRTAKPAAAALAALTRAARGTTEKENHVP